MDKIKNEKKKILLQTFKAFSAFCKENDLHYFAVTGTCLGAIRHKGFIPWDDDIDVAMFRKDYEKLIQICGKLNGTGYELIKFGDNSNKFGNYITPYLKFCDANTTIWERKSMPCIFGVFIDITPYDDVDNEVLSKKLFLQYHRAIYRYSQSMRKWRLIDLWKSIKGNHPKSVLSFFYNIIVRSHMTNFYKKRILDLNQRMRSQEGDECICYCGSYDFCKELFPKSFIGRGISVPFEDTSIVVPEQYEIYLKHFFGDWQTPPPPEQRISHHYLYFEDLTRRWTIEEVKKLNLPEEKDIVYTYE